MSGLNEELAHLWPVAERLAAALPHLGLYSFYAQTEAGFIACLRPEEAPGPAVTEPTQ